MAKKVEHVETKSDSKNLFKFVQKESSTKIHDEKFQTKPTTFLKDCFKRFCKNKSSVVGAIIIGVLLLGSFVAPLFNPEVNTIHTESSKLLPKIQEAGKGWWDGTVELKDITWNFDTDLPNTQYKAEDIKGNAIVGEYRNVRTSITNVLSERAGNATGGYLRVITDAVGTQADIDNEKFFYSWVLDKFNFTKEDGVSLEYVLGIDDNIEGAKLADLKFVLQYGASNPKTNLVIQDWVSPSTFVKTESGDAKITFNLSEILSTNSIDSVVNAQVMLQGKFVKDFKSYALIKSLTYTSTNTTLNEKISKFNIVDPVKTAQTTKDKGTSTYPVGFYQCTNASRLIYKSTIKIVDFTYDPYEHVFGIQHNFKVGYDDLNEYVAKGWCTFTQHNPASFVKLSDKCPVESVGEEKDGGYYCDVIRWKYLGYDKMPMYILGSDAKGRDLLTYSMNCLKTSLLVAIITSAVCLAIGLVWGSVSGYFGGTVDLIMERITDILSGVPWVVMMTLVIILLGNNIVTFALALVLTGWIGTASLTRTQFYRFRDREYVLASRTLGSTDRRLIFKHILPNALGTIVTSSVMMIPGTIFEEASISYLGLGLKGVASFGVLLAENQSYLKTYPALIIFPSIIISLLMISFNLFGNGLRDALNPTLKGGEK